MPTDRPDPETTFVVNSVDLDAEVERFLGRGYRIEMITPADAPSEVLLSGPDGRVVLRTEVRELPNTSEWITGRAGMEYRDLIPGRLNGKLIASHIRIADAGEVPDYVHYHKIGFQMIYCWRGRVRVVYQDQGEPFWLEPGDCVLQPPEIRHRVLEAAANTEVIELTSPAAHETWADHELTLPTPELRPDLSFGGQRFVRHIAAAASPLADGFGEFETYDLGIAAASDNAACVFKLRTAGEHSTFVADGTNELNTFYFLLAGRAGMVTDNAREHTFTPGDSILLPPRTTYTINASTDSEILCVII